MKKKIGDHLIDLFIILESDTVDGEIARDIRDNIIKDIDGELINMLKPEGVDSYGSVGIGDGKS